MRTLQSRSHSKLRSGIRAEWLRFVYRAVQSRSTPLIFGTPGLFLVSYLFGYAIKLALSLMLNARFIQ